MPFQRKRKKLIFWFFPACSKALYFCKKNYRFLVWYTLQKMLKSLKLDISLSIEFEPYSFILRFSGRYISLLTFFLWRFRGKEKDWFFDFFPHVLKHYIFWRKITDFSYDIPCKKMSKSLNLYISLSFEFEAYSFILRFSGKVYRIANFFSIAFQRKTKKLIFWFFFRM